MKKYFPVSAFFLAIVLSGGAAFATHLGPVFFGKERTERTFYCHLLKDAVFAAEQEEASIKANESLEQFALRIENVVFSGACNVDVLSYVPLETIRQWNGRIYNQGSLSFGQISLVRATSDGKDIFVILPDQAPPPKK